MSSPIRSEMSGDIRSIRELLLETNGPDGKKLFSSGADLAKEIVELDSGHYVGKQKNSVSAMLTQVFRSKRSCPDTLREAILEVIGRRLQNQPTVIRDRWISLAVQAIDLQNQRKSVARPLDAELLFNELLRAAEQAEEQFIITSKTAEHEDDPRKAGESTKAGELREILVRHLGLYDEGEGDISVAENNKAVTQPDPKTRYQFLVPAEEKAIDFWIRLFQWITENNPAGKELDPEVASERLKYLDDEDFLQVYRVPSYVCGCSIVVFDPNKRDSGAFSLCYHPGDLVSVLKWDSESIALWKNCVFWVSIPDKKRVRWREVRDKRLDMNDAKYKFENTKNKGME